MLTVKRAQLGDHLWSHPWGCVDERDLCIGKGAFCGCERSKWQRTLGIRAGNELGSARRAKLVVRSTPPAHCCDIRLAVDGVSPDGLDAFVWLAAGWASARQKNAVEATLGELLRPPKDSHSVGAGQCDRRLHRVVRQCRRQREDRRSGGGALCPARSHSVAALCQVGAPICHRRYTSAVQCSNFTCHVFHVLSDRDVSDLNIYTVLWPSRKNRQLPVKSTHCGAPICAAGVGGGYLGGGGRWGGGGLVLA